MQSALYSMDHLFTLITETGHRRVHLELSPSAEPVVVAEEDDALHVAVLKKYYLGLFTEGRRYWLENGPATTKQAYFHCLALLFTTNDHHLAWKWHDNVVRVLLKIDPHILQNELRWFSALACLRLLRVNKNSVVFWHLRRLVCHVGFDNDQLLLLFLDRLFVSMESHFANYICGFTLQWAIRTLVLLGKWDQWRGFVVSSLESLARGHLSDVSLWTTFSVALSPKPTFFDICHYKDLGGSKPLLQAVPDPLPVLPHLRWLLRCRCAVRSPYICLYSVCSDKAEFRSSLNAAISEATSPHEAPFSEVISGVLASIKE